MSLHARFYLEDGTVLDSADLAADDGPGEVQKLWEDSKVISIRDVDGAEWILPLRRVSRIRYTSTLPSQKGSR